MKNADCEKQREILEAIESGEWPERCDPVLRAHVAECEVCADLVLVATALRAEGRAALEEGRPPEAGQVWWKAQLQAKRAAAERAVRPIRIVERLSGACGVLALAGAAFWQWPRVREWLERLPGLVQDVQLSGTLGPVLIASLSVTLVLLAYGLYAVRAED